MVGETPPTLKAAMDETGRAGFRFGRAFSVADRARREGLARVLKMDEKESNVETAVTAHVSCPITFPSSTDLNSIGPSA